MESIFEVRITLLSQTPQCASYRGVNCSNFLGVKNTQYLKNSMVYITLQRQISAVCITQSISTVYITMWSQVISVVLNHTAESNCAPWSQNQKCIFYLYNRISWRNWNHILKFFSLFSWGLDGFESGKNWRSKNSWHNPFKHTFCWSYSENFVYRKLQALLVSTEDLKYIVFGIPSIKHVFYK